MRNTVRETARIFSTAKVVNLPLLNRLGLQVFRTLAARTIYRALPTSISDENALKLLSDGMLRVPNFLPEPVFEALRSECYAALDSDAPRSTYQHGPTTVVQLNTCDLKADYPAIAEASNAPSLLRLLEAGEHRAVESNSGLRAIEVVTYSGKDGVDQETDLHVDTFFHNHKAWLYLEPVREEHGPLAYVPGSHTLDFVRVREEYRYSISRKTPSRRVGQKELEQRGMSEELLTCDANTLVIANTTGYHRRSKGLPGRRRVALHASIRQSPFMSRAFDRRLRRLVLRTVT